MTGVFLLNTKRELIILSSLCSLTHYYYYAIMPSSLLPDHIAYPPTDLTLRFIIYTTKSVVLFNKNYIRYQLTFGHLLMIHNKVAAQ